MHKNAMFRGCTRPPMFMGVPYVPFFMGAGGCMLLAMYFDLLFLGLDEAISAGMKTCRDAGRTNCHVYYSSCSLAVRIRYGLSNHDIANLIAIAKVESMFNPDAATPGGHSSASGVFQITDSTARDAHERLSGKLRINGHVLGVYDRFDFRSNIDHGIAVYLDKKALAKSDDAADIYKAWNTNPSEYNKLLEQLRRDSSKYQNELLATGGLRLDATGAGTPMITSSRHPGHALYDQALRRLEKWNQDHHIDVDPQRTKNAAAALAVVAHRHALKRIDHVEPSANGDKLIALQGAPGHAHSKFVDVQTLNALHTSVAQSSQAFMALPLPQAPVHPHSPQAPELAPLPAPEAAIAPAMSR